MSFVFAPPAMPGVLVYREAAAFPVDGIHCVGRNDVEHATEMGHTGREAPFSFLKPADSVLPVAQGSAGGMHCPGSALA